jgi:hypothetical protein
MVQRFTFTFIRMQERHPLLLSRPSRGPTRRRIAPSHSRRPADDKYHLGRLRGIERRRKGLPVTVMETGVARRAVQQQREPDPSERIRSGSAVLGKADRALLPKRGSADRDLGGTWYFLQFNKTARRGAGRAFFPKKERVHIPRRVLIHNNSGDGVMMAHSSISPSRGSGRLSLRFVVYQAGPNSR